MNETRQTILRDKINKLNTILRDLECELTIEDFKWAEDKLMKEDDQLAQDLICLSDNLRDYSWVFSID